MISLFSKNQNQKNLISQWYFPSFWWTLMDPLMDPRMDPARLILGDSAKKRPPRVPPNIPFSPYRKSIYRDFLKPKKNKKKSNRKNNWLVIRRLKPYYLLLLSTSSIILYFNNQYNTTNLNQITAKSQLAAELDPAQPHLVLYISQAWLTLIQILFVFSSFCVVASSRKSLCSDFQRKILNCR